MKFSIRMKFFVGLVVVVILSAGLFLYLDYSMSHINSLEAYIGSDSYTVGIDYSSIVEKQYVEEGAYVKVDDPLFELRSASLTEAIRNNQVSQSSLLYSLTDRGTVLITAAAEGRVQTVSERVGAFVPANSDLATINLKDGLYVKATYKLSSPDYARLSGGKIVITLPDGVKVEGKIYDISLETRDKQVLTTLKARIDQSKVNQSAFTVGTPVETVLSLSDDTLASRLTRFVTQLFQPSGR